MSEGALGLSEGAFLSRFGSCLKGNQAARLLTEQQVSGDVIVAKVEWNV